MKMKTSTTATVSRLLKAFALRPDWTIEEMVERTDTSRHAVTHWFHGFYEAGVLDKRGQRRKDRVRAGYGAAIWHWDLDLKRSEECTAEEADPPTPR